MGTLDGLRGYGWIQVGTDGFGLLGYVRCACLTGRGGGDVATRPCGGDVATVPVGGVSVGDGWEWGMEGICGLQGRWGWLERATKGEESGTYFVRRSGWVLLASASSEARAADVFLLRASVA